MKLKFIYLLMLFAVFAVQFSFAQEKTITGTVTTASDGLPLLGATIIIKGTSKGTQTDFDGSYSITANQGDVLEVSYVGYESQSITVGEASKYDVVLQEGNTLEEVVVVAYGEQSEKKVITSVTKINNEAINDLVVDSPQNILQGQAAGVQMFSSSGILGSATEVRIRGTNSISGSSRPLFVIDGVVLGDVFLTGGQGSGQGLNPLASINPHDIENISVLKSAAAAALYGSRGGNGVVLITTKRGNKDGKVTVDLDMNTSFSTITDTPDVLTADEYINFTTLIRNAQTAPLLTRGSGNFDYIDAVTRTGESRSYNLGVRGGNEKTNYFFGATRENQEGILKGNSLERTSFRSNTQSKVTNWLTATLNANVSHNKFDRTPAENAFEAPYTTGMLQRPDRPLIDADGNFTTAGPNGSNVVAQELLNLNLATTTRIIANGSLDLDLSFLLDGLSFKQDFGIDRTSTEVQEREVELLRSTGSADNEVNQQNRYFANSLFSYNKTFADKHTVSLLVGTSYDDDARRSISIEGTGFLSDDQQNVESASVFPETFSSGDAARLISYLARASYDYADGRYIVEGSIRRDGSSRFGINNRFGIFWSAAVGWNISDEKFMENVDWIQGLKLNGSYGTTGNDRIGLFPALGTFAGNNFDGQGGITPNRLSNPDLKWESTTTFDVGLSASFLNRRLSFNVEYFKRITNDLILFVPLDPTFNNGLNGQNRNVGEVQNTGVDVSIDATIFNTPGGFKWTSNFNMGYIKNEVTELPESANVDERGRRFITQGVRQRAILGHSANTNYLIPYLGVNPQTGNAEWLGANGNPTTTPVDSDRRIVGKANPDFVGGFTNIFSYKNWRLSTLFNYSFGNDLIIDTRRFTDDPTSTFNKRKEVLNVWRQPGDIAFMPNPASATIGTFRRASSRLLEDGSFIRLKNVTLSYNLPQKLLNKLFINKVRLYATATNILTFKKDGLDGVDPEASTNADGTGEIGTNFFTVPQASTFTLGVNFSF